MRLAAYGGRLDTQTDTQTDMCIHLEGASFKIAQTLWNGYECRTHVQCRQLIPARVNRTSASAWFQYKHISVTSQACRCLPRIKAMFRCEVNHAMKLEGNRTGGCGAHAFSTGINYRHSRVAESHTCNWACHFLLSLG